MLHMLVKACVIASRRYQLTSPLFCHAKLMNTSGMRKSATDIANSLMIDVKVRDMPPNFIDPLRGPELILMRWRKRAQRHRKTLDAFIDQFLDDNNGDWREFPAVVYVKKGLDEVAKQHLRDRVRGGVNKVCYSKAWTTPVPSKFRGVWEAQVEHLLMGSLYGIGPRTCRLLLGSEDLHNLLEQCASNRDVNPESMEQFRATKAARATKIAQFVDRKSRLRDICQSVACEEQVYSRLGTLMAQQPFVHGSELDAPWSLYTVTAMDRTNPVLLVFHELYLLMDDGVWSDFGSWFYNSPHLPNSEICCIEGSCSAIMATVWAYFVPTFLWQFPNPLAQAARPGKSVTWKQDKYSDFLNMNACCRQNPAFADKFMAVYQTPASVTRRGPQGTLGAWVRNAEPHTLLTEVRHWWQKQADAVKTGGSDESSMTCWGLGAVRNNTDQFAHTQSRMIG